jgi:sec-independent protein translocase protein TatA
MIGNIFGSDGIMVLIIAVVVLFGGSQLPKLAKNVGSAGHEFRKAQREAEAEHAATAATATVAPLAPVMEAAPTMTTAAPAVTVPGARPDDMVVVRRSELRDELAKLINEPAR